MHLYAHKAAHIGMYASHVAREGSCSSLDKTCYGDHPKTQEQSNGNEV